MRKYLKVYIFFFYKYAATDKTKENFGTTLNNIFVFNFLNYKYTDMLLRY